MKRRTNTKNNIKKILHTVLILALLLGNFSAVPNTHAKIVFQDDDFAVIESEGLILDFFNQSTGNITIQFGDTLGEFIRWNSSTLLFEFSDDIDLNNHQLIETRLENVSSLPGGGAGLGTGGRGRVVQLQSTDSTAPGCTTTDCVPGTYAWDGSSWDELSTTTASGGSTKVLTVGPSGRDHTAIDDAADDLNAGSGGIILVDPGTYSITSAVNLENIQVVGKGSAETTIDISGSGQLDVINTTFRNLTIDVDSGISDGGGLDVRQTASFNSPVRFERTDFIIGTGKVLLDSNAGTDPVATITFQSCNQSGADGNLVLAIASSNLDSASTFLVDNQLGTGPLQLDDWDATIIGNGNVNTTGTVTTAPDRTVFVSPGMNIQGSIDSLGSLGGKVKLLTGTHDITAPLTITDDSIEIEGEGPATILRTLSGTWTGGTGENDAMIQVGPADGTAPVDDVVIMNLTVQVGPDIHGISVNGGSENKVKEIIMTSIGAKTSTHTGIVFTDGSASIGEKFTAVNNIINNDAPANRWVDGMHFDGNADFAGQLFGYGNGIRDSVVYNNIVSESTETSFAFSETQNFSVNSNQTRNVAFTAGAFGMFFNDAQDMVIANNSLEGANIAGTGISLFDNVDNSIVIGNVVRGGPVDFAAGINNAAATNELNIITDNQIEDVTTRIIDSGTETKIETKHHRDAADPTATDDVDDGYEIGTIWINTTTNESFLLLDHTAGAAIWLELSYTMAQAGPPAVCGAGFAGSTFMDTDSGIMYVCDTSNGRNKWLSPQDIVIFGDEGGSCPAGSNPNTNASCNVDWGNGLGPDGSTDLGFYIPHDITITGAGFSQDNDACTSGSFDLEVWSTGSNTDDDNYSFEANIATGLTGEEGNSNSLNIDVAGNQYIIWGIDNNCGQTMDDWNLVIYYRYHHT